MAGREINHGDTAAVLAHIISDDAEKFLTVCAVLQMWYL